MGCGAQPNWAPLKGDSRQLLHSVQAVRGHGDRRGALEAILDGASAVGRRAPARSLRPAAAFAHLCVAGERPKVGTWRR